MTAGSLGINQSAAITSVKPSGNTLAAAGLLVGPARPLGALLHPQRARGRDSPDLQGAARRRRADGPRERPDAGRRQHLGDPLPGEVARRRDHPQRPLAPSSSASYWLQNKLNWTEHNPSRDDHLPPGRGDRPDEVDLGTPRADRRHGVPARRSTRKYAQLPYIEIDKEEYERRVAEFPEIDFSKIWRYESRT